MVAGVIEFLTMTFTRSTAICAALLLSLPAALPLSAQPVSEVSGSLQSVVPNSSEALAGTSFQCLPANEQSLPCILAPIMVPLLTVGGIVGAYFLSSSVGSSSGTGTNSGAGTAAATGGDSPAYVRPNYNGGTPATTQSFNKACEYPWINQPRYGDSSASDSAIARATLQDIQAVRSACGLSGYRSDSSLSAGAQSWANTLANRDPDAPLHSPDGGSEIVFMAGDTRNYPQAVHDWLLSRTHHGFIVDRNFQKIGVGAARAASGRVYIVARFSR